MVEREAMAELLTVNEVAQVLKMRPGFVYKQIERGRLPHIRLGNGRTIRVNVNDLTEWLKVRTIGPRHRKTIEDR